MNSTQQITQIEFDFSSYNHIENSAENQNLFEANKEKFSNQCKIVYEALLRGERLTTALALIKYNIGDLRARIRDLIAFGVPVQKEILKGGYKEYYLNSIV